jgi:hypothetical protein
VAALNFAVEATGACSAAEIAASVVRLRKEAERAGIDESVIGEMIEQLTASKVKTMPMQERLNKSTTDIKADGMKGIPAALREVLPNATLRRCCRHLVQTLRKECTGKWHDSMFWAAQKAPTLALHAAAMTTFKKSSPSCVEYLNKNHPPITWAFYCIADNHPVRGDTTSNDAESVNASRLANGARYEAPFGAAQKNAEYAMDKMSTIRAAALKRLKGGQLLTSYAQALYDQEQCRSNRYAVKEQQADIYYVQHETAGSLRHRVDFINMNCTQGDCTFWTQYKIPCTHAIAAATASGRCANYVKWIKESTHHAFLMTRYAAIAAQIHVELVDISKLVPDGITKKNNPRVMPGRPKKNRMRSRAEGYVNGQPVPQRAVKQYRCGKCGSTEHTARRCRY